MDNSVGSLGSDDISGLLDRSGSDHSKSTSSAKSPSEKEPTKKSTQGSPSKFSQEEESSQPIGGREFPLYDVEGPRKRYIQRRHETMATIFAKHKPEYDKFLGTKNISLLKEFIQKYYGNIVWYEFLQKKLEELVDTFASTDQKTLLLRDDMNADTMIEVLRDILEESQRKVAAVDVSFDTSGTLEGSVLNAMVEKSRKKMTEVIQDLQFQIRNQQAEIGILQEDNMRMKTASIELEAAMQYIKHLHEKDKYNVLDPPSQDMFIAELRFKLESQEQMSSSLLEELENEKKTKEKLLDQYLKLESLRARDHQERLKEVAEAFKDLELEEGIRRGITEKVKSLSAKPEEIEEAVKDWLKATHAVMQPKEKEIQELKQSIKSTDDEIAKLREKLKETKLKANEELFELKIAENKLEEMIMEIRKHYDLLRKQAKYEAAEYNQYVSSLSRRAREMEPIPEEQFQPREITLKRLREMRPLTERQYQQSTPRMRKRLEELRPKYEKIQSGKCDFSQVSPEITRQGSPEYMQEQFADSSPISNIQPTPPRGAPEISVTPPSPTLLSPEDVPVGSLPEYTPEGFKTPYIPKSRFGYTDPRVKVLNLPPGPQFQMATPFRQTVVLTSPKRSEPLLVNIDVDPKPLEETETGEHFICDISLDVQPGHQDLQSQQHQRTKSSPTVTYGIPPAETPTSTRKYGLFTPRGIFRKRHFNIRRVPDEYYIPDLPWSPIEFTPASSPAGPLSYSPFHFSDGSISWERSPESFYGESPEGIRPTSASHVMTRTVDQSSPVIKGPSFRYRPDVISSTHEKSPSPLIKRPSYRCRSPGLDGTFESSSPPLIQGPSYSRQSPRLDGTFESSSPPLIQGPSYSRQSPRLDGTFESSQSPLIRGPSHRTRSPASDNTFERSISPAIRRPDFVESPSTDRSFQRSPSSAIENAFHEHETPPSFSLSNRSASPMIQGSRYRYQSPELSSSFNRSQSPLIGGQLRGGPFDTPDSTSDSSHSSVSRGVFTASPQPIIGSPLYASPPSGYQPDFDSSGSPEFMEQFDRSFSGGNQSSYSNTFSSDNGHGEDSLNRRVRLEALPQGVISPERSYDDDPLNRRVQLDAFSQSGAIPPESSYDEDPLNRRVQMGSWPQSDAISPEGSYSEDPLYRRVQLDAWPQSGVISPKSSYGEDHLNRRVQLDDFPQSDAIPPESSYNENPLNRRVQMGSWPHTDMMSSENSYREDLLNKRVRFNVTSPQRTDDSSFSSQRSPTLRANAQFSDYGQSADLFNRRMPLDEIFGPGPSTSGYRSRSPSPDSVNPFSRGTSLNKTYDSGASDFDNPYLEGSLNERSMLNESVFYRSP